MLHGIHLRGVSQSTEWQRTFQLLSIFASNMMHATSPKTSCVNIAACIRELSSVAEQAMTLVNGVWPIYRASELDLEIGSHHGSQQGSAAASSFEGQEMDEDEAAAAADFTPMNEEKRIFVNEWIAKLGQDGPDDADPVEVQGLH